MRILIAKNHVSHSIVWGLICLRISFVRLVNGAFLSLWTYVLTCPSLDESKIWLHNIFALTCHNEYLPYFTVFSFAVACENQHWSASYAIVWFGCVCISNILHSILRVRFSVMQRRWFWRVINHKSPVILWCFSSGFFFSVKDLIDFLSLWTKCSLITAPNIGHYKVSNRRRKKCEKIKNSKMSNFNIFHINVVSF